MNVAKFIKSLIEERLLETKNPCKLYSTENSADKIGMEMSVTLGKMFDMNATPCRYMIIYIEQLNKYTPVFDMTELLSRKHSTGGYIMYASSKGFYTY